MIQTYTNQEKDEKGNLMKFGYLWAFGSQSLATLQDFRLRFRDALLGCRRCELLWFEVILLWKHQGTFRLELLKNQNHSSLAQEFCLDILNLEHSSQACCLTVCVHVVFMICKLVIGLKLDCSSGVAHFSRSPNLRFAMILREIPKEFVYRNGLCIFESYVICWVAGFLCVHHLIALNKVIHPTEIASPERLKNLLRPWDVGVGMQRPSLRPDLKGCQWTNMS